ncbi:hypothetical protein T4D_4196 [Trichinella pseudospiralis]|uniref:Secreted protein n=1 Tax=Trichinella pseudospiralis TaxID=6337 RepID=A0A0V1F6Q0_TRIPS|nr:hypothetical protein T4D_6981 [Trichinella pseudospiralis]KRY81856.1 hypothetical protein T4D_4196 [Trichinella pseudospiralis]
MSFFLLVFIIVVTIMEQSSTNNGPSVSQWAPFCRTSIKHSFGLDFLTVTVGDLRRLLTGRRVAARCQDFLCIPLLA